MALTTTQQHEIYKLAVGMYNAAPGTIYMNQLADAVEAGVSITELYNILAASASFQNQNFAYSDASTNEQFVAAFLQNLLDGTVTSENMAVANAYLVGLLESGSTRGEAMQIAIDYLDNVSEDNPNWGAAAALLSNRIEVAQYYTETLNGDSTNIDELQNTLVLVTSDNDSVALANNANSGASGDTFVFTSSVDDLLGTSGSDTFIATLTDDASVMTFNTGDVANGGVGDDLLRLVATGENYEEQIVELSNIEKVQVQNSASEGLDLDASGWTGVNTYAISNSNDRVEIRNITEAFTTVDITNFGFGSSSNDDFSLFVADDVFTDSNDTLTLNLDRAGSNSDSNYADFYIQNDSYDDVIENLIVNSQAARAGDENYLWYNNASDVLQTITITGAAGVAFEFDGYAEVTTIDASGATGTVDFMTQDTIAVETDIVYTGSQGTDLISIYDYSATGVTINVSTGDGDDTVELTDAPEVNTKYTFDLGAGDDSILASSSTYAPGALNQVFDGGDGSDTLAVALVNVGNSTIFENFDILDIAGIGTSTAFDASIMTGSTFTGIAVTGSLGANATVNNTGFSSGLTVTGSPNYYHLTLGFSGTSGTSDALDIVFDDNNTLAFGTLKINGIETFNIESTGGDSSSDYHIISSVFSSSTVTTINVTGDTDFQMNDLFNRTSAGLTSFTKFDASDFTGNLDYIDIGDLQALQTAATEANVSYTVLGGSGDDYLDVRSAAANDKTTTANIDLTAGGDDYIYAYGFFSTTANVTGGTVGSIINVTGADAGDMFDVTDVTMTATLGGDQDVGTATNIAQAIDMSMVADATDDISWFVLGGNTYIAVDVDTSETFTSADTVIKLVGTYDLSDATWNGSEITLA